MKNKIYKFLISIGNIVAILLMIMPIIILNFIDKIGKYWWLLLIFSICYDVYMYSIIHKNNEMEECKKLYFDVYKGKALHSETQLDKYKWYEVICINMLTSYFNNDEFKDNLSKK